MTSIRLLSRRLALGAFASSALLVAGCIIGDKDTPTGSEVENEYSARIFLAGGTPAANASVKVYPVDHNPQGAPKVSAAQALIYSTRTDSKGGYSLDSLPRGEYNILSEKDGELAYQDSVFIAGTEGNIASDTLRDPGSISGRVVMQADADPRSVTIQLLGTNIFKNVDEEGRFELGGLADGVYRARLVTTNPDYTPLYADLRVRTGRQDTLTEPLVLIYTGIPLVENIRASLDTLNGSVIVEWSPVTYSRLLEYVIMTRAAGGGFREAVVAGTTRDTVFNHDIMDLLGPEYEGQAREYRVAVRNKSLETGKSFASSEVRILGPSSVQTFLDFETRGTTRGIASIGDTLTFILSFHNQYRKNVRVEWTVEGIDGLVRGKSIVPVAEGKDTLKFSWNRAGTPKVSALVRDDGEKAWSGFTRVGIVEDVPVVFPTGKKNFAVFLGDTTRIRGQDRDEFGRITKWEWDLGGTGVFSESSGPDTLFVPQKTGRTFCVLRITDDDGNSPQDTLWFDVRGNMGFVRIPAGTFVNSRGKTVSVPAFRIMAKELTRAQYFVGADPGGDSALPMVSVGLYEAMDFCNVLSEGAGRRAVYGKSSSGVQVDSEYSGYRLPTADEWEYAARAGNRNHYWQSTHPDSLDLDTWYAGNSGGKLHAVGGKRPNAFGLYDMNGNASEYAHHHLEPGETYSISWEVRKGSNWASDYAGADPAADFDGDTRGLPDNYTGLRLVLPDE